MGTHKGTYAGKIRWHLDGGENAGEEQIRDAVVRHALRALNRSGKLGDYEITHYKGIPLKP